MTSISAPVGTTSPRPTAPPRRATVAILAAAWVVLAALALAALALAAHGALYFDVDLAIARAVQTYQAKWFFLFMVAGSWPGFPPQINLLVVLIFVLLYLARSRWKALSFAFAAVGIAATQLGIKLLVDRPRPSPALIHVVDPGLIGGGMNLSFPAGHPATAVAVFGFLGYLAYASLKPSRWRAWLLVGLGAFMVVVGYSRIYQGEHWFSDVVAGYLLGSIWLIVTIYFYEWGKARLLRRKRRIPASAAPALGHTPAGNAEL